MSMTSLTTVRKELVQLSKEIISYRKREEEISTSNVSKKSINLPSISSSK